MQREGEREREREMYIYIYIYTYYSPWTREVHPLRSAVCLSQTPLEVQNLGAEVGHTILYYMT